MQSDPVASNALKPIRLLVANLTIDPCHIGKGPKADAGVFHAYALGHRCVRRIMRSNDICLLGRVFGAVTVRPEIVPKLHTAAGRESPKQQRPQNPTGLHCDPFRDRGPADAGRKGGDAAP